MDSFKPKSKKRDDFENIFYYTKNEAIEDLQEELRDNPKSLYLKDPDFYNASLLHLAVMNGRVITSNLLIARGINIWDVDKRGSTCLHYSALRGQTETTLLLLQKGMGKVINIKNQLGMTLMHDACYVGRKDMVFLLIEYGGDMNMKDNAGRLPVDLYGTDPSSKADPDAIGRWKSDAVNEYNRIKEANKQTMRLNAEKAKRY